jgi:hypothetical protein
MDIKYVSLFMSMHIFLDFGLEFFNASPVFGTLKELFYHSASQVRWLPSS